MEAALYHHVQEVVKKIDASDPEQAKYKVYAESFRIPYWDWARKDTQVVPAEALDPCYHAPGPQGSKIASASDKDDYNPLYLYKFPEGTPTEITVRLPACFLIKWFNYFVVRLSWELSSANNAQRKRTKTSNLTSILFAIQIRQARTTIF
jgi:hypothetical protein